MEAVAMDKLVEKGEFRPQVAQAIAEALDITIKAGNFVTVPMLDMRFAQFEAKMEARFGSIEKSLEATKAWAVLLYAGLTIALFTALAVDHHWIVSREDQLMAQVYARSDARFAEDQARSDARFAEDQARSDARFAQLEARMDTKFDQLRAVISSASRKSGAAAHSSAKGTPTP
jgi:hypothetical protein